MRIILINREEPLGGISIYTKRLEKYLRKHGHEVFIMSFTNKKSLEKNTFTIPYYIGEDNSYILLPKETAFNMIRKYFQDIKPDIIYTPIGLSSLDFLLPTLCRSENIPIIGVWHVDFSNEVNSYQLLIKSLFLTYLPYVKQLDLLHVFTNKVGQFYINQGVEKSKVFVLPNGINYEKYSRKKTSDFQKKYNIEKGVVFVGRLSEEKNPEILIRSFLMSSSNYPNVKLILVG
jgi:glycosyltransferase involved in cell wall biosynthesis